MAKPLALEYTAPHQQRINQDLIDALPYIDPLPADVKRQVDALIEEELKLSDKRPADYLKDLPPLPTSSIPEDSMLHAEFERMKLRQPMAPLDTSRYGLMPPPQNRRNDVSAWRACVDNAHAQLEHQALRLLNLELLLKHGSSNWRAQVQTSASLKLRLEEALAATRKAIDAINRERKLQQTAVGGELAQLERQYMGAVLKNIQIEGACASLEAQVHDLKGRIKELQPPSPTPPPPRTQSSLDLAQQPSAASDTQAEQGSGPQQQAGSDEAGKDSDGQGAASKAAASAAEADQDVSDMETAHKGTVADKEQEEKEVGGAGEADKDMEDRDTAGKDTQANPMADKELAVTEEVDKEPASMTAAGIDVAEKQVADKAAADEEKTDVEMTDA